MHSPTADSNFPDRRFAEEEVGNVQALFEGRGEGAAANSPKPRRAISCAALRALLPNCTP
eukprot:14192694-Alexandrium_andersonii.AAC.1